MIIAEQNEIRMPFSIKIQQKQEKTAGKIVLTHVK